MEAVTAVTGLTFLQLLDTFGLPISFIAVLVWFLVHIWKSHKAERSEWRKEQAEWRTDQRKLQESTNETISKTNDVIRELTTVIARSR